MRADPAGLRLARRRRTGAAQVAAGWGLAVLLHAGLIAALVLQLPAALPVPAGRAAVSLLLQPPAGDASPVAPRPPETPARTPAAPTAMIASAPAVSSKAPRPVRAAAAHRPAAAAHRPAPAAVAAASRPAPPGQGEPARPAAESQDFVAAAPLSGNVNPPPEYPPAAVAHGEQGEVLLSIHVLPNGRTDFVSVTRGSGYRILDQAAADAVLQWRFQPATLAGRKVVMVIPFRIAFDLQSQTARPAQ